MTYNISRKVGGDFDAVVARVKDALKTEGFGVLTEIDVAGTLKAKIDKDFRPYRILGACNPSFAYQALSTEAAYRRDAAVQRHRPALRQRRGRGVLDRSGDGDADGRQRRR